MDVCIILLLVIGLFLQYLYSDGLLWNDKPGAFTYGPQGSNISMRWHYKVESKETFTHSEIRFESRSLDLASRHTGENSYIPMKLTGDTKVPFSVVGKTNVTLTVYNADFSYVGSYCCEVTVKINNLKPRVETCTSLYVYELPRITYNSPDQSCKQGDQVKLQCNATGYPHPQFKWTRRDANKIIANSSVTSLNIIGKRSSGRYCCHVTNRFGKETKCTSVLVTEYRPIETTISSNTTYIMKNKMFQLTCNADAQPRPYFIFSQNSTQIYNSSNGIYTSNNITGDKAIDISCIPWNKYGKGPRKRIILPVYDPPKFTDDFRTRYNMTISSINITCRATGIPTPNVTWTEGDTREIISTKEYYEIPYVKCANKMLTFCCCADNGFGNIKSQPIQVQVMTEKIDCPESSKDISLELPPNDSNSVPAMTTLGTTVILSMLLNTFLILYIIWERRKENIFFKKTKTQRSKGRNDEKLLTPNTKMIEYKPMKYEPMIDFPIPEPNPIMPKQQESCSSQETSKEHQNTSTTLYESVEDLRSSPTVNAQVQEEEEQTANPKQGRTVIEITFLRQRSTKTTTDGVPKQLPAKECTNVLIS